nr:hypothetical protein CFP56_47810 [Quercus suber]
MGSSQGSLLSLSQAWDLDENAVKGLVGKQSGNGIVQLRGNFKMPEPKKEHREGMALNCEEAPLDMDIKKGGRVVVLNTNNLPLVGEVGLGADLVRLDGSAKCSPGFSCDSALQMTYIIGVVGVFRLQLLMVRNGSLSSPPQSNIHPLIWKDFSVESSISSGAPGCI